MPMIEGNMSFLYQTDRFADLHGLMMEIIRILRGFQGKVANFWQLLKSKLDVTYVLHCIAYLHAFHR